MATFWHQNASSPPRNEIFYRVENRRILLPQLLWFFVFVAVTGFGVYLSPSPYLHGTHEELGLPPCPSVLLFNRPCPACGLTTSFTSLIHGNFHEAFEAHPFGPILYILFGLSALISLFCYVKKLKFNTFAKPVQLGVTALITIFLLFGAYRFAVTPNYRSPTERHIVLESRF